MCTARSVVAAAFDGDTGEVFKKRLTPASDEGDRVGPVIARARRRWSTKAGPDRVRLWPGRFGHCGDQVRSRAPDRRRSTVPLATGVKDRCP